MVEVYIVFEEMLVQQMCDNAPPRISHNETSAILHGLEYHIV